MPWRPAAQGSILQCILLRGPAAAQAPRKCGTHCALRKGPKLICGIRWGVGPACGWRVGCEEMPTRCQGLVGLSVLGCLVPTVGLKQLGRQGNGEAGTRMLWWSPACSTLLRFADVAEQLAASWCWVHWRCTTCSWSIFPGCRWLLHERWLRMPWAGCNSTAVVAALAEIG
jgi:hypothetical protein